MGGIIIRSSSIHTPSSIKIISENLVQTSPPLQSVSEHHRDHDINRSSSHSPRNGIIAGLIASGIPLVVDHSYYQSSSTRLYATLENSVELDIPLSHHLQITSTSASSFN